MNTDDYLYCYKYLGFDKDGGSFNVLKEGTMKYTCPLEFNDPFDCRPSYCKLALNNLGETKKATINKAMKVKGLSPAQRIQQRGQYIKKLQKYVESESQLRDFLRTVGVVSLSTDPRNILMWSHYADFHKGFLVEFKIPIKKKDYEKVDLKNAAEFLFPLEVNYSAERPALKYGVDSNQENLEKLMLTKSILWEYESEYRVIDQTRGPGIHSYHRDKVLCSVIAGMNISDTNYDLLGKEVSLLREHGLSELKLYKAEASKDKYEIVVPGHPRCS